MGRQAGGDEGGIWICWGNRTGYQKGGVGDLVQVQALRGMVRQVQEILLVATLRSKSKVKGLSQELQRQEQGDGEGRALELTYLASADPSPR